MCSETDNFFSYSFYINEKVEGQQKHTKLTEKICIKTPYSDADFLSYSCG